MTWTAECEEACRKIKRHLSNASILAFPRLDVPFILDTDASDSGLGAVLSQVQDGQERVIAYAERALSKAERNFKSPRGQMARWLERLSDFDVQHRSGRLHNNADGLSHFPWDEQGAKLREVESEVA